MSNYVCLQTKKQDGRRVKCADGQIQNNAASTPVLISPCQHLALNCVMGMQVMECNWHSSDEMHIPQTRKISSTPVVK